ncbi:hypothetical protein OUY22_01505 [Nonomuraea sp. MCN248]|uniref:Uncharacterized protein n=1 Tax=Nonomuraea corallina TaxID=2989783 RepID=A0ABT4S4J4_9ACTN|nr:hypothetical protein [Nonomuraea corallina]MDA0632076.1 hypothetical protein [Nonomuraea corallina]
MRILRVLSVTAASAAALTIALTGAALADPPPPGNCTTGYGYDNTRNAYCASGYGFVRVKLTCANDYNKRTTIFGKWVGVPNVPPAGTVSYARCSSSYPFLMSVGYETKPL